MARRPSLTKPQEAARAFIYVYRQDRFALLPASARSDVATVEVNISAC